MRIAVVIPARDEADQIAAVVENARRRSRRMDEQAGDLADESNADRVAGPLTDPTAGLVEVVVVDGGSRDRTAEIARAAGAVVVETQPGRARQLEAGWRKSSASTLLFLHADTRLPSGWAAAIEASLADPAVVGGAFRLRFEERSPGLRLIEWGARVRARWFRLPYGDQAIFARREVLEAMGGVPQVPLMEDLDLVRELRRRGRLVLLPLFATTSARRYRRTGAWRTWWRNSVALLAWKLGLDRDRIAAWYRR